MPSQRIEKIGIIASLCIIMLIVIFNDPLTPLFGLFTDNPKTAMWGAVGSLVAAVFGLSVRVIISANDSKTKMFQMELRQSFNEGVSGIKSDIGDVREDVSELHCAVGRIDDRVGRIEKVMDDEGKYRDEKRRRWEEFDNPYWIGIKADFDKLRNNDIYRAARILKDKVREFTHEVLLSDLKRDPKLIMDFVEERGRAYTEDMHTELRRDLPGDFVDLLALENATNRSAFKECIVELLTKDRINSRADGIYLASRTFLRRTHNTLYLTWCRYAEAHADTLATDPVSRYFTTKPKPDSNYWQATAALQK